jgi:choline-glycine betaine transporter
MNDLAKVIATAIIWGCLLGILATSALWMQGEGMAMVLMTLILALAATVASMAVWIGSALTQRYHNTAVSAAEYTKTKRSVQDRLSRLVETMDEDQLNELGAAIEDISTDRERR